MDGVFGDFYEKTIYSAVVNEGMVSPYIVNLFAVNKLRKHMAEKYPDPTDGEALDKHIRAQLCAYGGDKKTLNSASPELHRHLQSISTKLLKDVKKLTSELEFKERQRQKEVAKYEKRAGLIERAEKLADEEINKSGVLTR